MGFESVIVQYSCGEDLPVYLTNGSWHSNGVVSSGYVSFHVFMEEGTELCRCVCDIIRAWIVRRSLVHPCFR